MRAICQARYLMGTLVEIVADNAVENPPLRGAAGLSLRGMSCWKVPSGLQRDIPLHPLQRGNRSSGRAAGSTHTSAAASDVATTVRQAFERFEFLEKKFSRFDPESELSKVNSQAGTEPVEVSAEFFEVVSQGIEYSQRSEGAFSVALAPLTRLWMRCIEEERFPGDREVNEAQRHCDFRCIKLDRAKQTIQFGARGAGLDVDGLVKGFAVDEAKKILQSGGVSRGLISAGNSSLSVFAAGGGKPHCIGLRHPSREKRLAGTLLLANGSLSTSGTYERGWQFRGRNVSHLIDPRTGTPLQRMSSATALCESALLAEVASKVLLFHGCRSGVAVCDANGWAVEGAVLEARESEQDSWLERSNDFPFLPIAMDRSSLDPQSTNLNLHV
jgi:thiamine biosynthesis lipoprotein